MRCTLTQTLVFATSVGCAARAKALIPTPPTIPTTEGYEQVLNSWVGADADLLLRAWGSPNATFPMTDGTLWTYSRASSYRTNIYSTTTYNSLTDSLHTTTTGGDTINLRCQTEFEIDGSNRIVRWRWSGNSCRSVPEPASIDCTGAILAGRVWKYQSEGGTVAVSLYLPEYGEDLTLPIDGRHLEYLDAHWKAQQWVAVCRGSGRGPYLVTYPQKKFISIID